ncbi:MAG: protein-glutamate O-methyltransferase [Thermodesulfobacteriota bacterium]|nr:protein-glutamate O-methyltransferase [Thermodesulfobacteriota bacterium]
MTDELTNKDFKNISRLVYELCGINLHEGKKALVSARLGKNLRKGGFKSFDEYLRFVRTKEGSDELILMINSLSTNLTSFFREAKHFLKLEEILPELLGTQRRPKLRVWSAGCSTGEEPYSLAIMLSEAISGHSVDLKILATDISTGTLQTAVAGVYSEDRLKDVPRPLLRKYFQLGQERWEGHYRVKKSLKDIIEFKRFNLMDKPVFNNTFDVIFCRNVMIYFDKKTQNGLVNRFCDYLKQGGYLFIGHSESLTGLAHRFKYDEPTVYRK